MRVEDGEDGRRDNRDFIRTETVVVVRTAPTDGGGAGRVKQVEPMGPETWFSATQEPFLPPSRSSGPASDRGRRQTAAARAQSTCTEPDSATVR